MIGTVDTGRLKNSTNRIAYVEFHSHDDAVAMKNWLDKKFCFNIFFATLILTDVYKLFT